MDMRPEPSRYAQKGDLPLPGCVALVLQGGGALGSFQAGGSMAAGDLIEIDADVLRTATEQARMATLNKGPGELIWPGLLRRLDRLDPGYRH